MKRDFTGAVALRTLLAAALLSLCVTPASADLFDKLKKQAKDSVQKSKNDMEKTVQDETGIGAGSNAASLRADAERMAQTCYEQAKLGSEYSQCASLCKAISKSMTDIDGSAKLNESRWQHCKKAYDTALASGKGALVQSENEKELGVPAGTLDGGSAKKTAATGKKAAADKPAADSSATKAAAKPVVSKPATLDAAAKAEVDKFAASCPKSGALTSTYDCGCLAVEYGNTLMDLRADKLADWENNRKAYEEDNLARAKQMAAERNDPSIAERGQKRYEEAYATWHKMPRSDAVNNRLLGENGTGKRCFSREAIVKTNTENCLETPGKKLPSGTPTDATYCGCLANEMASNILDKGMQFGPARNHANLSCDPAVSGALKSAKK